MNQLTLFFKHQWTYLLFLVSVFFIPLFLFLKFSPFEVPQVSFVFLGFLLASQFLFYEEKKYRARIKNNVTHILQRELGKIPSQQEIIKRSTLVVQLRGISIMFCALLILILMFYFKALQF
jgi:hypothetical protein